MLTLLAYNIVWTMSSRQVVKIEKDKEMLTEQELQNVVALIEAGARAICTQKPMKECVSIMAFAAEVTEKVVAQNTPRASEQIE